IDLFGLDADQVRKRFPEVYQHLLSTVKPERDVNRDEDIRARWWLFGRTRDEIRPALEGLPRYIVTVETAKHRVFQFLDASILPDNRLVCFALADAYHLGILSSRIHVVWTLANGGTLEDRPIYTKVRCFDPFPFPDPPEALKAQIRETAEELDALRKRVQAEHLTLGPSGECLHKGSSLRAEGEAIQSTASSRSGLLRSEAPRNDAARDHSPSARLGTRLTLTQIYNVLEKLRACEPLTAEDEIIKDKGLVLILRELHGKIDALVAEAYGWPTDLSDDEILARLIALNAGRAAEEKRGFVRWLRPDYQRAKAGVAPEPARAATGEQLEAELVIEAGRAQKPAFPAADVERMAAVYAALAGARAPLYAREIASTFRQGAKIEPAISRILKAWARIGQFHTSDGKNFSVRRSA
ncbi:MAG: class I SAM-dependent DNA methyltransferase, partial [Beijerinckiaceae bacterium]|nr:class I SAM-dependent DNA methyltransferase [Beijerinckiaceae bacterium]